jgi:hypothetical protein
MSPWGLLSWKLKDLTARRALLAVALLVAVVKATEFALDSQAVFFYDSGAFILNALRMDFIPDRSYVYGGLIRIFAVPFHSLKAIVAMQSIMGGCTAWLLAFALMHFFSVRPWIAMLAALAFALDPVQVLHEHMVMTETAALLAMSVYLLTALQYIREKSLTWLALLAFLGTALVSLRLVYVPGVLAAAILVPAIAYFPFSGKLRRAVALAIVVSCGCTILFHEGYRHLTGRLAHREPAYTYTSGTFLLGSVTPIVEPGDSRDARVAAAVIAQSKSRYPLLRKFRGRQMWSPEGLIARMKMIFGADRAAMDEAARGLALAAIRRNPPGYLAVGAQSWIDYWRALPGVRKSLMVENGMQPANQVNAYDAGVIDKAFGADISTQNRVFTLSRRYNLLAAKWQIVLLISPFLGALGWRVSPANRRGAGLLFLWSELLLAATLFGETEPVFRYLHPFSFTGLAATAILGEALARRIRGGERANEISGTTMGIAAG